VLSQGAMFGIGWLLLAFIALRREHVRRYAMAWLLLDAIFGATLYLLLQQIPAVAATPDIATGVLAAMSILPLAWIPYLAASRRVRETFDT
jgi:hypothetical protein